MHFIGFYNKLTIILLMMFIFLLALYFFNNILMIRQILLLLLLCSFATNYSQDSDSVFSDVLRLNINKYNTASNIAFEKKDFIEGKRLFDSLVKYNLVGTTFDDFSLQTYNSKTVKLNSINKPVYLITYASWCVLNDGDIPALNKLSKEYKEDVQIIVLFWDKKENIKKLALKFDEEIKVCYADDRSNNDFPIIATLKHTLGLPTSYFLDENKKVVDIKRIVNEYNPQSTPENSLALSYERFNGTINDAIKKNDTPVVAN
jgi:thiol-disulfide isomerase/thioredoxin